MLRFAHLLVLCVCALTQASPSTYRAATVEHVPFTSTEAAAQGLPTDPDFVKSANVKRYSEHAHAAAEAGAQIIVFPEDGLFGDSLCTRESEYPYLEIVPPIGVNACNDYSEMWSLTSPALTNLSCLASELDIVVVFDLGEIVECSVYENVTLLGDPCPEDGHWQFNSQVAIGNDGTILAVYRKSHIFYEPQSNQNNMAEPVTFTTDFGVTFGMLICFDLMFGSPAASYMRELGVNNIVYSTWWLNTPPWFSAAQYQQSWSRTFESNLLAAGNGDNWLYSGSGIYSNGTALDYVSNPSWYGDETLLIADVPIVQAREDTHTRSRRLVPRTHAPAVVREAARLESSRVGVRPHKDVPTTSYGIQMHCPINETYSTLGGAHSLERDLPVWRSLPTLAKGMNTTGSSIEFQFIEALPGTIVDMTARASTLTCHVRAKVSLSQPILDSKSYPSEYYVLMAYEGVYDEQIEFYVEQFCSFFRCLDTTSCLSEYVEYALTEFDSWSLTATFEPQTTAFAMTSTSGVQLLPRGVVAVSEFVNKTARVVTQGSDEFGMVLLGASTLGRDFSNDDA